MTPKKAPSTPRVDITALCVPTSWKQNGKATQRKVRALLAEHNAAWAQAQSTGLVHASSDDALVDRLVSRSVEWANRSYVVVGDLGGSGGRGVAAMLMHQGVFMPHVHPATLDSSFFWPRLFPQFKQALLAGPARLDYQPDDVPRAAWQIEAGRYRQEVGKVLGALRGELKCYYQNLVLRARLAGAAGAVPRREEESLFAPPWSAIGWKNGNSAYYIPLLRQLLGAQLKYVHLVRNGTTMMWSDNLNQLRSSCTGGKCFTNASSRPRLIYAWDAVDALGAQVAKCYEGRSQRGVDHYRKQLMQAQMWAVVNRGVVAALKGGGSARSLGSTSHHTVRIEDFVRGIGVLRLLRFAGIPCSHFLEGSCEQAEGEWGQSLSTIAHVMLDKSALAACSPHPNTSCAAVALLRAARSDRTFGAAMSEFGYWPSLLPPMPEPQCQKSP